ncbi:helix-turn-helix transcriptional regulator [Sporomusa acidovorans]|uniref:HTH luxR-type domain-containing protein n=1 Tax=Sporomusa acidovorans (strain ATCC 49682 / DSM 3132 / Mol) TaxID=1123286 RepID=A0ABZ3IY53_SPOA4|nr:helix-turn-helix transcriptional regulator [Sporomusa acidovorans]OZC17671.1 transcriptional regulatory protein LiaR [Sporomusa acidovorans DSM 3132]SDE11632.1 regulatory protein, luxR family [Sporomusa acidovorans]
MYWSKYWEIFDQAKQGFCIFNCRFEIIYANNKAKQLLGNSVTGLYKQLKGVCRHFKAMAKETSLSNYSGTLSRQPAVINFTCFSFYSAEQSFIMIVFDYRVDEQLASRNKVVLTLREKEILRAVAAGKTNKEISEMLSIGFETVKSHIRNLFAKTGTSSRAELISKYCHFDNSSTLT